MHRVIAECIYELSAKNQNCIDELIVKQALAGKPGMAEYVADLPDTLSPLKLYDAIFLVMENAIRRDMYELGTTTRNSASEEGADANLVMEQYQDKLYDIATAYIKPQVSETIY